MSKKSFNLQSQQQKSLDYQRVLQLNSEISRKILLYRQTVSELKNVNTSGSILKQTQGGLNVPQLLSLAQTLLESVMLSDFAKQEKIFLIPFDRITCWSGLYFCEFKQSQNQPQLYQTKITKSKSIRKKEINEEIENIQTKSLIRAIRNSLAHGSVNYQNSFGGLDQPISFISNNNRSEVSISFKAKDGHAFLAFVKRLYDRIFVQTKDYIDVLTLQLERIISICIKNKIQDGDCFDLSIKSLENLESQLKNCWETKKKKKNQNRFKRKETTFTNNQQKNLTTYKIQTNNRNKQNSNNRKNGNDKNNNNKKKYNNNQNNLQKNKKNKIKEQITRVSKVPNHSENAWEVFGGRSIKKKNIRKKNHNNNKNKKKKKNRKKNNNIVY
ncbi:stress response protein nst1 [Anaeramoeba flamelloides]|uniref:Stress response protein nst1 n=1 Tax=Anaeramoeba flamelloides TaxID=1746091 RepID=A0ABQ8Y897_9EUKA|nr:stress response protein nst1 [Anaeramoeba flamelloides]